MKKLLYVIVLATSYCAQADITVTFHVDPVNIIYYSKYYFQDGHHAHTKDWNYYHSKCASKNTAKEQGITVSGKHLTAGQTVSFPDGTALAITSDIQPVCFGAPIQVPNGSTIIIEPVGALNLKPWKEAFATQERMIFGVFRQEGDSRTLLAASNSLAGEVDLVFSRDIAASWFTFNSLQCCFGKCLRPEERDFSPQTLTKEQLAALKPCAQREEEKVKTSEALKKLVAELPTHEAAAVALAHELNEATNLAQVKAQAEALDNAIKSVQKTIATAIFPVGIVGNIELSQRFTEVANRLKDIQKTITLAQAEFEARKKRAEEATLALAGLEQKRDQKLGEIQAEKEAIKSKLEALEEVKEELGELYAERRAKIEAPLRVLRRELLMVENQVTAQEVVVQEERARADLLPLSEVRRLEILEKQKQEQEARIKTQEEYKRLGLGYSSTTLAQAQQGMVAIQQQMLMIQRQRKEREDLEITMKGLAAATAIAGAGAYGFLSIIAESLK